MGFTRITYTEEQKRRDEEHLKDVKYYNNNYHKLLAQYPERWIGIFGQQVVESAASEDELIARLKARGFRWDLVFRSRLTKKEENLITTGWGEEELRDILNVQGILQE